MASSTVSGVGSGIDTAGIVKALADAEKAPKQAQINAQTLAATTTLSAVGAIQSALDTYRTAIAGMNTTSNFNGLSATSSATNVATATVDSTASNGNYALSVSQLATASKISTTVLGSAAAVVNSGAKATTLTITQSGNAHDVNIPAGATLQQVRDSINSQLSTSGISANILTDSNGSRLVLSSSVTGSGSDLKLTGNSGLEAGVTVVATPQNAKYTIDGIPMSSSTNSVAAAVSGVGIKLLAVGDSTITVATSADTLKTSVQSFVDAYNTLMTAVNTQTKVTIASDGTTTAGGLTGDASVRNLVSSIRNQLVASSGTGTLQVLSQFGVSTDQQTGLLAIDDTKWNKAVASNAADIAGLFTGSSGLIARMTSTTDVYAQSGTGIFASRSSSLSSSLTDLKNQQATLDRRITTLTTTLTAKYTAMDTLVAQLNATSSSVMTTLNALNKTNSN